MLFGGLLLSDKQIREELNRSISEDSVEFVRTRIYEHIAHIPQKTGALLAAQAIFLAIDTWGLQRTDLRLAALVSEVLLVASALISLMLLRSVYIPIQSKTKVENPVFELMVRNFRVLARRSILFNLAVLMTIVSVLLIGLATIMTTLECPT